MKQCNAVEHVERCEDAFQATHHSVSLDYSSGRKRPFAAIQITPEQMFLQGLF